MAERRRLDRDRLPVAEEPQPDRVLVGGLRHHEDVAAGVHRNRLRRRSAEGAEIDQRPTLPSRTPATLPPWKASRRSFPARRQRWPCCRGRSARHGPSLGHRATRPRARAQGSNADPTRPLRRTALAKLPDPPRPGRRSERLPFCQTNALATAPELQPTNEVSGSAKCLSGRRGRAAEPHPCASARRLLPALPTTSPVRRFAHRIDVCHPSIGEDQSAALSARRKPASATFEVPTCS